MRKLFVFCLALMLALGCVGTMPRYVRTPQQMSVINDAIVALVDEDVDEVGLRHVYCSGSFVSRTQVLTAAHCVDHANEFLVVTRRGYVATNHLITEETAVTRFELERVHEPWDLALIRVVPGEEIPLHHVLRVAASTPTQGEYVVLMGHAQGLPWSLTQGVVSYDYRVAWPGDLPDADPLFIQHDASASPGNSGGPLLNHNNQIAGVLIQGWHHSGHLSMSVHTTLVQKFLRGQNE